MLPGIAPGRRKPYPVMVLILSLILIHILTVAAVFPVSAADMGNVQCSKVDQFGNPVCTRALPPSDVYVPEDAPYPSGNGQVAGMPVLDNQYQLVKKYAAIFANISLRGPEESINQTLHPGTYYYNIPQTPVNLSETGGGTTIRGVPGLLTSAVTGVKDLQEVSSRAVLRSFALSFSNNPVLWNTKPLDNVTTAPDSAMVPDEDYLTPPEPRPVNQSIPVKVPISIPERPLQPAVGTPVVLPTVTPPPVPVFNLSVDSYPQGALIVLNGNRTGMTPYTMKNVPTSVYTLNLTRSGYVPYGTVINLDKDTNISVLLTNEIDLLFPKAGTATGPNQYGGLYISSFPDHLPLTIDGVSVKGGTPFLFYGLPEGYHTIQVTKDDLDTGTTSYSRMVWIYHDALVRVNINTEEPSIAKQVAITSVPYSGAEFTMNGLYPPGTLPATITMETGGSFVSVHDGDAYISVLVPALNTDPIPLDVTKPDHPHAPLQIDSNPEGAEIFIDGFRTGSTTPHTFNEISAGLHRIGLSIPGYYPSDAIITVPIQDINSSAQRVFYPLENYGEGTIFVDSMPRGASIYLNGWSTGEVTPHTFDHLKIGFYEVVVSQGGEPWIDQVELTPDRVYKVVANFNIFY